MAQESLANAAKHAGASNVALTLEYAPDLVRLTIADDGVGFGDPGVMTHGQEAGPGSGFGLVGMRERLGALGGSLELRNDHGGQVFAVVPREK